MVSSESLFWVFVRQVVFRFLSLEDKFSWGYFSMLTMFVFSCSCSLKTLTCAVRFATASALKGAPPGKYFRLQNWKNEWQQGSRILFRKRWTQSANWMLEEAYWRNESRNIAERPPIYRNHALRWASFKPWTKFSSAVESSSKLFQSNLHQKTAAPTYRLGSQGVWVSMRSNCRSVRHWIKKLRHRSLSKVKKRNSCSPLGIVGPTLTIGPRLRILVITVLYPFEYTRAISCQHFFSSELLAGLSVHPFFLLASAVDCKSVLRYNVT